MSSQKKVRGTDKDSLTRQKTSLLLKQKQPGLFVQSASGNDGQVSRTCTGRKPSTAPGMLQFSRPVYLFFLLEKSTKTTRETQAQVKRATAGGQGGVIQAAHVSGFRIKFSKQFTPMMMTAQTQHKACREGGATDCVAIYQPKGVGGR